MKRFINPVVGFSGCDTDVFDSVEVTESGETVNSVDEVGSSRCENLSDESVEG